MSEKSRLLRRVQQMHFMVVEAMLFMDTHGDCREAGEAFNEYNKKLCEAKAEYEDRYGPLTSESIDVRKDGWSWVYTPWPWELEDC